MRRYIISSVEPGCELHKPFLTAMENYCSQHKNTQIILIPSATTYDFDKLSKDVQNTDYVVSKDLQLNKNIKISLMPIDPEQADPVSGLNRLNDKDGSIIYASPKQRLKSIPSPNSGMSKFVMTPGAATYPSSKGTKRGLIAKLDHVVGAIIVEIENSTTYHFRQIQADNDGTFYDLGYKYNVKGTKQKINLEAIIPGDYHNLFVDPTVKNVILNISKEMSPKYLFLHDFFDGISVNHHIEHKILEKATLGNLNDLSNELLFAAAELKQLSKYAKQVVVVKSNHDEFLDRWLSEGKYVTDARNHIIGLELALAKAKGQDPLEYGLKKFQTFDNVKFLKSTDSFEITPKKIECGQHGHRGPNGSRGNASSLELSYGNIVFGHTHTPEILRGAFVVGTSTYLQLNYNIGPSSWLQTLCLVYPNGSRQLINVIKGRYCV